MLKRDELRRLNRLPHSVLPSQWNLQSRQLSPEQRLMLAVLQHAWIDAVSFACGIVPDHKNNPTLRTCIRRLEQWLPGADAVVTFNDACEAIGLEPSSIRRAMLTKLAGAARSRARKELPAQFARHILAQ